MKQRHSFHTVMLHLVFRTKYRERIFLGPAEEERLFKLLRSKSRNLDMGIEVLGSWDDHVHLLGWFGIVLPICEVIRRLKGYAAWYWTRQTPHRPLRWGDGAYVASVDANNCEKLKRYIQHQRIIHARRTLNEAWESS